MSTKTAEKKKRLDVLVCGIAEYIYELCRILTSLHLWNLFFLTSLVRGQLKYVFILAEK